MIKLLHRTLQIFCNARLFSSFQKLNKISEFNKKQSLPRIQVIPISDEEVDKEIVNNECCKDIDKSIVYNQVFKICFCLSLFLIFF